MAEGEKCPYCDPKPVGTGRRRLPEVSDENRLPDDFYVFPWGKFKGEPIGHVPRWYIEHLLKQDCCPEEVREYDRNWK